MNRLPLLLVMILLSLVGCSSRIDDKWTEARPEVYPAKGVVLTQAGPVEGATVVFRSRAKEVAAYGTTDREGRFSLTTFDENDGAVAGEHEVRITKIKLEEAPPPENPEANPIPPKETNVLPTKYGNFKTSGLTADVVPDGTNEFEFTLDG